MAKSKRTDLECMKDDMCWGMWPYLPIKRFIKGKSAPDCGLIWAYRLFTEKKGVFYSPIPVFDAFIYQLPPTREAFLETKKYEYATLEALVADGWIIDD